MKLKPITVALAAGSFLGFSSLGTFAQTNAISFDADGTGGVTAAIDMAAFDWGVSSLLSVPGVCPDNLGENDCNKSIPVLDTVNPTYLKSLTHARMNPVIDANGNPTGLPVGLNTAYEITFVAGSCIVAKPAGSVDVLGNPAPRSLNLGLSNSSRCVVAPGDPSSPSAQFFEIWYDDLSDGTGTQSNALSGSGYRDGKLILKGNVTLLTGTDAFTETVPTVTSALDQFGGVNNYPGITTVILQGSTSLTVLVDFVDTDFFKSGVGHGSLLPFTGEVRLPFRQTNPSASFYSGAASPGPDVAADVDPVNGASGPHLEQQADASNAFQFVPPALACRVTGGGNDTAGLPPPPEIGWDGTMASDSVMSAPIVKRKGKSEVVTTAPFVYTFGGQAGANTALPPQPKGQWEHQNHDGPNGLEFNFKIGTSAAPKGTKIAAIACTDDGFCRPARPAPNKQIDFVGTGSFTTMKNNTDAAVDNEHTFAGIKDVVPVPSGKRDKDAIPTYHWFQVHIEDLGEPGSEQGLTDADDAVKCPPGGSGNDPFASTPIIDKVADCDCEDFYRIRIYKGFIPQLDENDNITNTGDINKTDVIYEVWGYINGGNFQIHPLTGFDLK